MFYPSHVPVTFDLYPVHMQVENESVYLLKMRLMANGSEPKWVFVLKWTESQRHFSTPEALLQFLTTATRKETIGEQ